MTTILRPAYAAVLLSCLVAGAIGMSDPVAAQSSPALVMAAERNDADEVRRLLHSGAPLDARDGGGRTALLAAVDRNHGEIARLLIGAGADVNAQADNLDTPWLLAGASGRTGLVDLMLSTGSVDYIKRNRYGGNALIPAAHHGHVDTVRLLLQRAKIDVDHINNLGWTALLEAVILGDGGAAHTEIVRLLVAAGANVNLADREGRTPLAHARLRNFRAIERILVDRGAR